MNMHKGARLTPYSRDLLVRRITEQGLRVQEAAQASGVSVRTAFKWLGRFRKEGADGLMNRSSRPRSCPHTTAATKVAQIIEQRRTRQTYRTIAATSGVAPSTVGRLLQREGLNRLASLEPAAPILRYEHDAPGDLLHLDIKKFGAILAPGPPRDRRPPRRLRWCGWEYVHVAIDDHSRVAFSSIEPNEQAISACKALLKALRYYRHLGVRFTRVLTDNGSCYRSRTFARLLRRVGLEHKRTRPYTPRTNGKAERFIQTALREWAYARSYDTSNQRAAHLNHWLHEYNWHRLHASLGYRPPITRIPLALNNVLGLHS